MVNRSSISVGDKFGRWTVLGRSHSDKKNVYLLCRCECGTEKPLLGFTLKNGKSRSCGCLNKEVARSTCLSRTNHGMAYSAEHSIWRGMKDRCKHHPNYAGRGIKVCATWGASFERFFNDMGPRPSANHSLERIDNGGDYEPGNCKWAEKTEQARNRRSSRLLSFNGETKTQAEWGEILGLDQKRIHARLARGWSVKKALTTPTKS